MNLIHLSIAVVVFLQSVVPQAGALEFSRVPKGEVILAKRNVVRFKKDYEIGKYAVQHDVTFKQVQTVIKQLNSRKDGYRYRLPKEAEWVYAVRLGLLVDLGANLSEWLEDTKPGDYEIGQQQLVTSRTGDSITIDWAPQPSSLNSFRVVRERR
jgi:hypothetical protein